METRKKHLKFIVRKGKLYQFIKTIEKRKIILEIIDRGKINPTKFNKN